MWGLLLEDETTTKFAEEPHHANLKIVMVMADMKKMPLKEKITKVSELKQLQQEVQTLYDQERKINDEFTTKQTKVEWVTRLFHPVQQKL